MNWDDLQIFLAVARGGRMSVAARRLGVEHTTVSRRVSALERELGVPLFYRTKTGCLLTAHGQNVVSNAEAMERAALGAAARAREGSGATAGTVRVALPPEFASHWLVPKLASFRATHPQITLQLLVGTRERDLARGEAELAIQSPRPHQQGLVAVRIGRTALALFRSKRMTGPKGLWIDSAEAVQGIPLLTYTSSFHMLQDARWFQPVLGAATVVLETNSTHALLAGARAGLGVAVLPRLVARGDGELVAVSENVAAHDVWLITHPEFRRDPKVRAASDFLKRIAAGSDGLC